MEEALQRATAYADAGADAILIHSKAPTAAEVTEFARRWSRDTPLVVVPTTYASTPLQDVGSGRIQDGHLRQSPRTRGHHRHEGIPGDAASRGHASLLDPHIASLEEVYDLVGVTELQATEQEFLPVGAESGAGHYPGRWV